MLGLHDYDGLLPDVSPGGLKAWTDKAVGLRDRVRSESHGLDKDGRLDALCLEAMQEAGKASASIREEFESLKRDAVVAMASFVEKLSEEHSLSVDFALGRERFQKLLWVNDRINRPVEEVLAMGLQDLESNLKAL